MDSSLIHSEIIKNVLHFKFYDDEINKRQRLGPKNYPAIRFIGSAEIIDLEGDIIDLQALKEVMPIMLKQGGRIQSFHMNHPGGEFFDWGFTTYKGVDAIWVDVEVYTDYPSQRENLRRILLPEGDKERINGLSLGGFKLAKQRECNELRCWTRITKLEGWEFSFVDNMANQLADNIEDKIDEMEFVSLKKEQTDRERHDIRDPTGRFAKTEPNISSITTTTTTNFDPTNDIAINAESCLCGKHIDKKGEYSDKGKKPREEEKPREGEEEAGVVEGSEVAEAIESEEELEEALDDEEVPGEEEMADGLEGEEDLIPDGTEESDTAERNMIVENNEMLRTLLTALNIEKEKPKMETENEPIEIGGKKYIKKGDDFIPFTEEKIVEIEGKKFILKNDRYEPYEETTTVPSGEGITAADVASIVTKSISKNLEPLAKEIAKLRIEKEEVTSSTDDPAAIQKNEDVEPQNEDLFYLEDASNSTIEQRLLQVHQMRSN